MATELRQSDGRADARVTHGQFKRSVGSRLSWRHRASTTASASFAVAAFAVAAFARGFPALVLRRLEESLRLPLSRRDLVDPVAPILLEVATWLHCRALPPGEFALLCLESLAGCFQLPLRHVCHSRLFCQCCGSGIPQHLVRIAACVPRSGTPTAEAR